jgi:hypothetical protein
MSLFKFQDYLYLEYKKNWFLWEPAWETFRPIRGIRWNGTSFVVDDKEFCADPLDLLYGYGSPQMKQICDALTERYASQISTATSVHSPEIGNVEWFFDRRVSLAACCPRTKDVWRQMVKGKYKTLRKGPAVKFTRRNRHS